MKKKNEKKTFYLLKNEGIFIERNNWLNFNSTNKETYILVLANKELENSKSIYNFNEYLNKNVNMI